MPIKPPLPTSAGLPANPVLGKAVPREVFALRPPPPEVRRYELRLGKGQPTERRGTGLPAELMRRGPQRKGKLLVASTHVNLGNGKDPGISERMKVSQLFCAGFPNV